MAQCDGILHVSFAKFVLYFVVLLLGAFDLCIPPYVFFFPYLSYITVEIWPKCPPSWWFKKKILEGIFILLRPMAYSQE